VLHAVRLLYAKVLHQPLDKRMQATPAKRPERLPAVLHLVAVRHLLDELSGI
jgi:hypothetical protein